VVRELKNISSKIETGAKEFLRMEYAYLGIFIVIMTAIIIVRQDE
jgi:Na+/H+-translocating membrane pyrophosphatase